ncbi:MAG TPA: hypothetical protein VJ302_35795, partial [Blastocatellia bacterium]|nr:hypothetical protein [Blastocatellia bacterium]
MSDSTEKQLIMAFCDAWGEAAPSLLGRPSSLGLLALREVSGEGLGSALAVAATWSSGFISNCSGSLPGVTICLFKSDDSDSVERLIKQPGDGALKPGVRALISATLSNAAARFSKTAPAPLTFGEITHLDLSGQESRLATIVGDLAWVGTFSLSIRDSDDTQALLLYAPHGSLPTPAHAAQPAAEAP